MIWEPREPYEGFKEALGSAWGVLLLWGLYYHYFYCCRSSTFASSAASSYCQHGVAVSIRFVVSNVIVGITSSAIALS